MKSPKKKSENKWQFKIFILAIILIMSYGLWNSLKEKSELKNSKTTVGTIIEIEQQFQRVYIIKYEFIVSGKKYTENQKLTVRKTMTKVGDKFEVNYSEKNPKYSELNFKSRIME